MSFETISVIGLGYIGLPTAAIFASRKVRVIGVDTSKYVVDTINHGKVHIVEPELDIAVSSVVSAGYLRATMIPEPAEAFLISVPTPFKCNHEPDLSYVEVSVRAIAPVLKKGDLVILESTSPVGTTEKIAAWMAEARPDLTFPQQTGEDADINVAHCPERVLPGHIIRELVENDRLIGGMSRKSAERSVELYKTFVKGNCILTDSRTAELAKLTENSFRDVNIAFANELSLISDKFSINVWELISLANRHPRVNILQPGPGVGGHCIAVDPWFIVDSAPDESKLIHTARLVNDGKPGWVIEKIKAAYDLAISPDGDHSGAGIACFGITFKADIDDLRESPAFGIVRTLADEGYNISVVEPNIHELPASLKQDNVRLVDAEAAIETSDVIVMLVDHTPFKEMDLCDLKGKQLVDTRGIFDRS